MKKTLIMCGIITGFSLCAESQPKADVHLKITEGPILGRGMTFYNGVCSVTNVGESAFTLVTDGAQIKDTIRFYQEADEKQQRIEELHGGKRRRQEEREEVIMDYDAHLEKGNPKRTLQPGEGVSFECKDIFFMLPLGTPGGVYKAEMYFGNNTWIPVPITPKIIHPYHVVSWGKDGKTANFFYAKDGTNQWLYVRDGDRLKKVSEIKLDSKPEKDGEDGVTFESPDGTQKTLTPTEARRGVTQ
ncbi:MAG: hypothetical protein FWH21_02460 [Kiritimatiellaeota bacterium]|nr:hypothetical protein [Kiritimatiellota bacterium]